MNLPQTDLRGFQLLEQIDESSRTTVWKALQTTLDRTVVIRVLKPEAASNPTEVEHFLSIARRVARIKSDALAAVFDIVSDGTLHYVVMEHVEGPTLEELVARHGKLPADQILRIAAALVSCLDQMWGAARLVHRNLKSATIRLDPRGVAKITDFSLAIEAGPGVDATAMDGGNVVGTPCFLSPEQAQGAHTLTTQSDMYALGAVLYHLSTGKVPFEEHELLEILAAHVKRQLAPPHRVNAALPVNFSWFVHRLMMKNPNSRYANWDAVLHDIRCLLAGAVPLCVRPDEEFLSTIAAEFDPFVGAAPVPESKPSTAAGEPEAESAPRVRLNRKTAKSRHIAAFNDQHVEDQRAGEQRRQRLIFESACWAGLVLWLAGLFWFRAVHQATPPLPGAPTPLARIGESFTARLSEAADELKAVPDNVEVAPATQPAPKTPELSVAAAEAPAAAAEAPAATVAAAATAPLPEPNVAAAPAAPATPETAAQPGASAELPTGLAQGLAQSLANCDLATARQLALSTAERFQTKEALQTLLNQVPEPEALVEAYLKAQVGKPLLLERNGKQRSVIVRGVENGIAQVEANGRGAELALAKLSPDEKLAWMEKPADPAATVAYCVVLMRSSRRSELYARASGCPLLAPVLIDAANRVPAAP